MRKKISKYIKYTFIFKSLCILAYITGNKIVNLLCNYKPKSRNNSLSLTITKVHSAPYTLCVQVN